MVSLAPHVVVADCHVHDTTWDGIAAYNAANRDVAIVGSTLHQGTVAPPSWDLRRRPGAVPVVLPVRRRHADRPRRPEQRRRAESHRLSTAGAAAVSASSQGRSGGSPARSQPA